MRKITAFILLAAFVAIGAASFGCAKKSNNDSYKRSIQRSNEGHRELERSVN